MDDKDKRIAELEARLKRMLCLQAAAETKLTMVQAEIGNQRALDADGDGVDLHAIERHLYDTPAPLAVVENQMWCPDCNEVPHGIFDGSHELPNGWVCRSKLIQPVTIIVLPKPKEGT